MRTNQAIKFLKFNRENLIKSLKYLESNGNKIISVDLNGKFYCLNELDILYYVSLETINSMMIKQEYTLKEIQYSNLVKLHCNLSYLDDINERRKIKCILSRLKLRIKNIGKKTRLKINKKNLKICEIQQALWMYVYPINKIKEWMLK